MTNTNKKKTFGLILTITILSVIITGCMIPPDNEIIVPPVNDTTLSFEKDTTPPFENDTTPILCHDTDGGLNYYEYGQVTAGVLYSEDYCHTEDLLVEFVCGALPEDHYHAGFLRTINETAEIYGLTIIPIYIHANYTDFLIEDQIHKVFLDEVLEHQTGLILKLKQTYEYSEGKTGPAVSFEVKNKYYHTDNHECEHGCDEGKCNEQLYINLSSSSYEVNYEDTFKVSWNSNAERCSAFGHHVLLENGGVWTNTSTLKPNDSINMIAKHAILGYMTELTIGLQCSGDDQEHFEQISINVKQNCYDSDGGQNIFEQGITHGYDDQGRFINHSDFCAVNNVLIEGYCLDDLVVLNNISWSEGCQNGRCLTINESLDDRYLPRIMYWWGKINQHWDLEEGVWSTDPDGVSGANIEMLTYCQKFYPNTASVKIYKDETTNTWKDYGNIGQYTSTKPSHLCIQGDDRYLPRIMYWEGKVNQHWDLKKGVWSTDPDGVSGANIDKLQYCQKFYGNITQVIPYKGETTDTWRNHGNIGQHTSTKLSYLCII